MDEILLTTLRDLLAAKPGQPARDLVLAAAESLGRRVTRNQINRALYGSPSMFRRDDEFVPRWFLGASVEHQIIDLPGPAHPLRSITLAGWKAFGAAEEVSLAPLTLLFGQNSAGKSSLIQSLLTLKQTIQSSAGTLPRLVLNGSLVEMGSFSSVAHGHDLTQPVSLGVAFSNPMSRDARSLPVPDDAIRRVGLDWEWDAMSSSVQLRQCLVGIGDLEGVRFERLHQHGEEWAPQGGDDRPSRFEVHEDDTEPLANLMGAINGFNDANRSDSGDTPTLAHFVRNGLQPTFDDTQFLPGYLRGLSGQPSGPMPSVVTSNSWNDWTSKLRQELGAVLDRVVYLGPMRQPLARISTLRGIPSDDVGSMGENTAEVLASDPALASEVSDWFERLGIPYRLCVVGIGNDSVRNAVGDVAAILLQSTDDEANFEHEEEVTVHPAAVGFGVGQVMPIVVQCLLSRNKVICIEQPEVHLHPRLQATLADLFLHSMERNHNQFIIETHSEHLLLRLQRRIREHAVDPDRLRLLYVESAAGGATVSEFSTESDGALPPEWPAGFFVDRLSEMLAR